MDRLFIKLIVPCGLVMSSGAFASGILLPEATYANLGAAGAGDGVYTESAAAIWTNPAVMSHMDSEKTTISGTVLNLDIQYQDANGGVDGHSNSTLPIGGFFHVEELQENLKLGLAFGSQGGATLDYGSEWQGSAQLTDVTLLTYQFNPSLSYAINEQLSVAVGAQLDYAFLEGNTSNISLDSSSDWAMGYNLGAVYQASDSLRLGLSYRSELNHEFDSGMAVDTTSGAAIGNYSTALTSPAIADFSAAYQLSPNLTLLTSLQWHDWSSMSATNIDLHFDKSTIPYSIERDWQDVWHIGVGLQYELQQGWAMKVGYSYETSPLDDPSKQSPDLPVGEQHRFSVGFSKTWQQSKLDLYYEYADFGEMKVAQEKRIEAIELHGQFIGKVHFIGVAYTF